MKGMKRRDSRRQSAKSEKALEKVFPQPGKTPKDDLENVIEFYDLPRAFPKKVLEEASKIGELASHPGDRLDLRKKYIFTCDPVTARDYDDAISLEKVRGGKRILGVHIADVSHFVRPGSAIDKEAYKRSTSIYLNECVIPMLPEALCNGVCSLVPNEDRLAFSVFITYDKDGKVLESKFAKTIIRSSRRFTYEQVMSVILGAKVEKLKRKELNTIKEVCALTRQLRARRFAEGALDIEIPETELVMNGDGTVNAIELRQYDESHQMIEECMVAANEAVAKELWTKGVKILSRLHESPEPEKIEQLQADLRSLGVSTGDISKPKILAAFLARIKEHPLYSTIAVMVLRSMKRAVYDAKSIGHFGLAKHFYAHFTSPIRRYPDLTLHRQLALYLEGKNARVPGQMLSNWAKHTSAMEERATEAERSLMDIKKYRLLEDEMKDGRKLVHEAIISKCTGFGCFIEIPELAVSGLVHISTLSHRYVRYDSYRGFLAAGGKVWRVGDKIKVKIATVDYDNRRLDFLPVKD